MDVMRGVADAPGSSYDADGNSVGDGPTAIVRMMEWRPIFSDPSWK